MLTIDSASFVPNYFTVQVGRVRLKSTNFHDLKFRAFVANSNRLCV